MSSSLHPLERRVLSALSKEGTLPFAALVTRSGLKEDQARRALQWLSTKGMVDIEETSVVRLEVARTPPELALMKMLAAAREPPTVEWLRGQFASPEEFSAAFGRARASGWVVVGGSDRSAVKGTGSDGPKALEEIIASVSRTGRGEDGPGRKEVVADLLKRGLLRRIETKETSVSMTPAGNAAVSSTVSAELSDRLTSEALSSGAWREKGLRPIDVEAKSATFFPGRRHPVRDFIREVKETYVSMGFTELTGDSIHPAFWNFDALFIPQDHPGREMQDTFYIEGMSDRKLVRRSVVANVASAHEDGWRTGSTGWGYSWRVEEARRLVLRTHNTVLTVRALSESKERETRVFAVSKVYRNENLDYKHLAEFHQMDGIMVGEGLNLRHLMGFLKEFYMKLGMKDVKLCPTFFPYTEPSLEVVGYSDVVKAWIELGGSGIFRPEVTLPLGVKVPVLAWGPGIERLMLMRFGLEDMRELYGSDLSWLRNRVELAGR